MTNPTTAIFTMARAAALAAIAGAALALAGCGSRSAASAEDAAPQSAESARPNPFFDPFAISSTGFAERPEATAHAAPSTHAAAPAQATPIVELPPAQSPTAAPNLYAEVMARSIAGGPGGQTPRGGGANFTQVSFSMEGADFDPSVSADGKQVVFASTQYRETADLFIKNVDSRVVTQLTNDPSNDVMPKLSPDGGRIAFASSRSGNWDIYVMPTTGGKAVQITGDNADDLHPTWSPDGTQIAFCRLGEVSGQWEMWVTDVGNNGVARFIGYGLFPEWCPVGGTGADGADRIAFQKSRERGDRAFGIWTIDYKNGQSGNTTEIASSPAAACINPAWAPDGKWIAYATVPNPTQWANSMSSRPAAADLWLVDINGNSRISLTSGHAVNLMPAWGPDNRVFFVSDRGGVDNLWAMDTGKVIALANANMNGARGLATGGHNTSTAPHTTGTNAPVVTVPTSETGGHDPH